MSELVTGKEREKRELEGKKKVRDLDVKYHDLQRVYVSGYLCELKLMRKSLSVSVTYKHMTSVGAEKVRTEEKRIEECNCEVERWIGDDKGD